MAIPTITPTRNGMIRVGCGSERKLSSASKSCLACDAASPAPADDEILLTNVPAGICPCASNIPVTYADKMPRFRCAWAATVLSGLESCGVALLINWDTVRRAVSSAVVNGKAVDD